MCLKPLPPNKTTAMALLLALGWHEAGTAQGPSSEPATPAAPKVILVIGDGMDQTQITIARNYLAGSDGQLTLDTLPTRSSVRTQTVVEEDPRVPEYVADSANSASSMASGIVTSTGRIGTTAGTDRDAPTILELAAAAGFGTGIVVTSSVTDATPASFVAHVSQRLCESPRSMVRRNETDTAFLVDCSDDLKANGGKGSIAEQIAASRVDIVLGGGARNLAQPAEGQRRKTVLDLAEENGYRVIDTAAELARLSRGQKVLGLFAPGTMPVQWRGADDAKAELVQRDDNGRVVQPVPFACEPNPRFGATPTLEAMARAALNHLDDGRSFALMVESSSIDKQSHARRPCGQIGEVKQLDDTLKMLLDYARAHPETLVLVTADHGQAAQLVPETSWLAGLGAASPGHFARLRTPEGGLLGVNYATNDSNLQEDHTGVDVPLFAYGAGAEEIPASMRQTDVFRLLVRHLGLTPPSSP
jgi:alkaline phosphatase